MINSNKNYQKKVNCISCKLYFADNFNPEIILSTLSYPLLNLNTMGVEPFVFLIVPRSTICPRSSDKFYIVS